MKPEDFETDSGVLILRARVPEEFDPTVYGRVLVAGEQGLTQEDIDAMRADGLFPVELSEEAAPGLIAGEWPEEITEVLPLVTGPGEKILLASRRLTIHLKARQTEESIRDLCRRHDLDFLRALGRRGGSFSVRIPRGKDPIEYASEVREDLGDAAEEVLPEFLFRYEPAWAPAGEYYKKQWQWCESGGIYSPAKPIHIEEAWEKSKGRGVRIAVIDRGFDVSQPDLKDAILDTSGHFPSDGDAEFQQGRDKVSITSPLHGTFCAGMAAAHEVEERGLVGAAPEADLVLLSLGSWTSMENIGRALEYVGGERPGCLGAIVNWLLSILNLHRGGKAEIVCMSSKPLGHMYDVSPIVATLDDLAEAEIPLFAPAGNDRELDISNDRVLAHKGVIVVTRFAPDGKYLGASSFGSCVHFAAPGDNVVSTHPLTDSCPNGWKQKSGTSYAAPCAGGVAALMLSRRPGLSIVRIREILTDTCEEFEEGEVATPQGTEAPKRWFVGAGRIHALKALEAALQE